MIVRDELVRLRDVIALLPEVTERWSHGAPCFYVRDQRALCYFHDDDFDDRGRPSLMCPAPAGVPEEMVATEPGRFYRPVPSTSGVFSDWIGVYLDTDDADDWAEVAAIVTEAFRLVAPKSLSAQIPPSS